MSIQPLPTLPLLAGAASADRTCRRAASCCCCRKPPLLGVLLQAQRERGGRGCGPDGRPASWWRGAKAAAHAGTAIHPTTRSQAGSKHPAAAQHSQVGLQAARGRAAAAARPVLAGRLSHLAASLWLRRNAHTTGADGGCALPACRCFTGTCWPSRELHAARAAMAPTGVLLIPNSPRPWAQQGQTAALSGVRCLQVLLAPSGIAHKA